MLVAQQLILLRDSSHSLQLDWHGDIVGAMTMEACLQDLPLHHLHTPILKLCIITPMYAFLLVTCMISLLQQSQSHTMLQQLVIKTQHSKITFHHLHFGLHLPLLHQPIFLVAIYRILSYALIVIRLAFLHLGIEEIVAYFIRPCLHLLLSLQGLGVLLKLISSELKIPLPLHLGLLPLKVSFKPRRIH